jgi:ankyrin repeat protein
MIILKTYYKLFEAKKKSPNELGKMLLSAIEFNNTIEIKNLIDAGADLNIQDMNGNTPLLSATISYVNKPTIKHLIDAGSDVNIRNKEGCSFLFYAILYRHFDNIKELINKGINISNIDSKGDNLIDVIFMFGTDANIEWLKTEEAQRMILNNDPRLISAFKINKVKIHPDIKKEYNHIISGNELGLI